MDEAEQKLFDMLHGIRDKTIRAITESGNMSKKEILHSLGLLASAIDGVTFYLDAERTHREDTKT